MKKLYIIITMMLITGTQLEASQCGKKVLKVRRRASMPLPTTAASEVIDYAKEIHAASEALGQRPSSRSVLPYIDMCERQLVGICVEEDENKLNAWRMWVFEHPHSTVNEASAKRTEIFQYAIERRASTVQPS